MAASPTHSTPKRYDNIARPTTSHHTMTSPPAPSPTVLYDEERRPRSDRLAPPDVAALMRSKRRWWRRDEPRSVRVALMCLSIAMSAVQANGVYCWST